MSLTPQGTKETTMALMDPSRPPSPRAKGGAHPAVWLVAGFGFIIGAAYAVHLVFNAMI